MPLFPIEPLDLPYESVGRLAAELLPSEEIASFGFASNEKSNNVMYRVRARSGRSYGLKFFRRDTVDIEALARGRVASFVGSAPFISYGRRSELGAHPYAIFPWIDGELIHERVRSPLSEAEADALARQLAAVLAGFRRTDFSEYPMPELFRLSNLVPFVREHYAPHLEPERLARVLEFCRAQCGELERSFTGQLCLVHGALQENVVIAGRGGELRVTGVIDWEHAWHGEAVLDYLYLMEGVGEFEAKPVFQERLHHHVRALGMPYPRDVSRSFMLISFLGLADKLLRLGKMSMYIAFQTERLIDALP